MSKSETKKITNEEDTENDQQSEEIYKKLSKVFGYLESKGLPVKNASYGSVRANYVRGDDLLKSLKDNGEYLVKEINKICNTQIDSKNENALQLIYMQFNDRKMLVKALRTKNEATKLKYPKRLMPYEENSVKCCDDSDGDHNHKNGSNMKDLDMAKFDEKMFYVVYLEEDKKVTYFWLIVAIVAVLGFCLFPVWPIEVKIGIWWISYILLWFMLSLMMIRLIIFGLIYPTGQDFWLFPNLFDDKLGIIDSFKPLYSTCKRDETLMTRLFKIAIVLFILYCCYFIYENPNSPEDLLEHIKEIYVDVFDYGKDKIINWSVYIFLINRIQLLSI
jgi:translocation protein SEC62